MNIRSAYRPSQRDWEGIWDEWEAYFQTELPTGHCLSLRKGDITEETVDAIVNAANVGLIHGGGVVEAAQKMQNGNTTLEEVRKLA